MAVHAVYKNNSMKAASGAGQKYECRLYLHLFKMGTTMGFC
jgi:hypothetical protein